jgi:hypothetical protein
MTVPDKMPGLRELYGLTAEEIQLIEMEAPR